MEKALRSILERRIPPEPVAAITLRVGDDVWQAAVRVPGIGASAHQAEPQFLVYSITKTFIAVLILQLCEAELLTLDANVARWFPRIPQGEEISLRMLLNHTAGLPDYRSLPEYHRAVAASPSRPWTFEEFAAQTYEKGLAYRPGQGWDYSNPGYMLLRRILEIESGERFSRLIGARILQPCGLHQTFVAEAIGDLASLVPAASRLITATGEARDVRGVYHPGWVSHGVLASTPQDVVEFYHRLFTGGLLSKTAIAEMTALVPVPNKQPSPWSHPGYGLGIMGDLGSRHGVVWGHNGGGPGYAVSALHAPNLRGRSATVCFMCALENFDAPESMVLDALDLVHR